MAATSSTELPTTSRKRKAEASWGFTTGQDVLNLAAYKYLQINDASNQEDLNGFVYYLEKVRKVVIVDVQPESLIITVECSSSQILEELWNDYCSGYVNEMAQTFLATEDILNDLGLTKVKFTTTILREEYEACHKQLDDSKLKREYRKLKRLRDEFHNQFRVWVPTRKHTRKLLRELETELSSPREGLSGVFLTDHESSSRKRTEEREAPGDPPGWSLWAILGGVGAASAIVVSAPVVAAVGLVEGAAGAGALARGAVAAGTAAALLGGNVVGGAVAPGPAAAVAGAAAAAVAAGAAAEVVITGGSAALAAIAGSAATVSAVAVGTVAGIAVAEAARARTFARAASGAAAGGSASAVGEDNGVDAGGEETIMERLKSPKSADVRQAIHEDKNMCHKLQLRLNLLGKCVADFAVFCRDHIESVLSSEHIKGKFRFLLDILRGTHSPGAAASTQVSLPILIEEEVNIVRRVNILQRKLWRSTTNQEVSSITQQILHELREGPSDEEIRTMIMNFIQAKFAEAFKS